MTLSSFWKSNKLLILLLVLVGLAVYLNTFRNGMFWDDNDFILQNQYIRDFQAGKFFSENVIAGAGFGSNYWRPVLQIVFAVEWKLFHMWSGGYHAVNLLFHLANGILLFYILKRLFDKRVLAFCVSLLFLVHPLQTEAVSYANSLGDSLSVFFMFAGALLFMKGRRFWPSIFYALALMSKETAIIMPGLLFLVAFFDHPPSLSHPTRGREAIKKIWPYLALAAIYILLRATTLNLGSTFNLYAEQNVFTSSVMVRIFTFFRILSIYLGLLFWPMNLHMERTVALATSMGSASVIFGGLVFAGPIVFAVTGVKKWPVASFGIFWFFGGLSPTSNIAVPINGLLYEHWLYLPMIGLFLAIIWAAIELSQKFGAQKILAVVFAVWICFFGFLTIRRNTDWHDPIRFYNQILKYNQNSYRVYNNLGMAYADANQNDEAEKSYLKAVTLDPTVAVAYHNLGNIYRDTGQIDRAVDYYQKAIQQDPKFIFST